MESTPQAHMRKTMDRFSESVTRRDVDAILACFSENCAIEFLNVRLKGRHGVMEWLKWLYGHMSELKFEDKTSAAEGNRVFQESKLTGRLHNGLKMSSRQVHIMEFDGDFLINNFRYYFDRLDFLESAINRIMAMSLRATFNQKTLKHLAKYAKD